MQEFKHTVLCVDDEQNILNSLKRLLRREGYRLLVAVDGADGLTILEKEKVHLVICDMRMPGMDGIEFLTKVKKAYADIMRIILTGYTDVDTITESVNKGQIYKFFLKPWNDQNLKIEIRKALEQYDLLQANKQLHRKVVKQNEELRRINDHLEDLVHERTKKIELQYQALDVSRTILEDLPIPVVGVTMEGMVVMHNRAALELVNDRVRIAVGSSISDCVHADLQPFFQKVKSNGSLQTIAGCQFSKAAYDIDLFQLSGKYKGQGIMLVFRPVTIKQKLENNAAL